MQVLHNFFFMLITVSYTMHVMDSLYGSDVYSSMGLCVSALMTLDE